jgi:hypothetical protein
MIVCLIGSTHEQRLSIAIERFCRDLTPLLLDPSKEKDIQLYPLEPISLQHMTFLMKTYPTISFHWYRSSIETYPSIPEQQISVTFSLTDAIPYYHERAERLLRHLCPSTYNTISLYSNDPMFQRTTFHPFEHPVYQYLKPNMPVCPFPWCASIWLYFQMDDEFYMQLEHVWKHLREEWKRDLQQTTPLKLETKEEEDEVVEEKKKEYTYVTFQFNKSTKHKFIQKMLEDDIKGKNINKK